MYLGPMQTQLKGRLMGGQVCGRQPRRHAGEHKAFVRICEALYESLRAGLSEWRTSQTLAAQLRKGASVFARCRVHRNPSGVQVPGSVCGRRERLNQWAGLQTLPQWADNSSKAPVAQTKCPYPALSENANHRGLKPAGALPPKKGLRPG